jgi:hypothetical protein
MKLTKADVTWIIDRRVTGRVRDDESVFVTDSSREMTLKLSADCQVLTFNGQRVDVGDDLYEYLGVMDEIERNGESQPFEE